MNFPVLPNSHSPAETASSPPEDEAVLALLNDHGADFTKESIY